MCVCIHTQTHTQTHTKLSVTVIVELAFDVCRCWGKATVLCLFPLTNLYFS
jgi:hypothetical protein